MLDRAGVAQAEEHPTSKRVDEGSNPSAGILRAWLGRQSAGGPHRFAGSFPAARGGSRGCPEDDIAVGRVDRVGVWASKDAVSEADGIQQNGEWCLGSKSPSTLTNVRLPTPTLFSFVRLLRRMIMRATTRNDPPPRRTLRPTQAVRLAARSANRSPGRGRPPPFAGIRSSPAEAP